MQSDLVRVRLGGFETNVGRGLAAKHDLTPLDQPTHTKDGRPLSAVPYSPKARKKTAAAEKAAEKERAAELAETAEEANA